ncbi:RNA-binding protein Musashi 2, partial [Spiromyces aspiralis]
MFRPRNSKLFVGGLSWKTTQESLRDYFSQFGEVRECLIKTDESGNPRGFGFVEYVDTASVENVLNQPEHYLDGKKIDPKRAVPREGTSQHRPQNPMQMMAMMMSPTTAAQLMGGVNSFGGMPGGSSESVSGERNPDRVFVGGLPASVTADDLTREFSRFGTVLDTKLMMDRETGRSKGYAFIQFENDEIAQNVVKECNKGEGLFIHDKHVDVKSAVRRVRQPQQQQQQQQQQQMMMQGMPGMDQMGMMNPYMMMQNPQFMAMAMAAAAQAGYQMPGMFDPSSGAGYPVDPAAMSAFMMGGGAGGAGGGANFYGNQWGQQGQQQGYP